MKGFKLSILFVMFLAFSAQAMSFDQSLIDSIKSVKSTVVFIYPADVKKSDKVSEDKQGSGSGVVVDRQGLIVTNYHVVQHAKEVNVEFINGTVLVGKILGRDEVTDLAVVKVVYPNSAMAMYIGEAKLADSQKLVQGQVVFAIGNPFILKWTVTSGIISALDRDNIGLNQFEDFIQTDAAINPGNSGGGLFSLDGELIGINDAILNFSQNLGFSIPSNVVKAVLPELVKHGKFSRGWLGVSLQDVTNDLAQSFGVNPESGVIISEVFEKSPAETSRLRAGDIILSVNGTPISKSYKLKNIITMTKFGTTVVLEISRLTPETNQRHNFVVQILLTEKPSDEKTDKK